MTRYLLIGLALGLLAACDASGPPLPGEPGAEALAKGYTMEVRADETGVVYLVTAEDGRAAAARADKNGASALLDQRDVRALASAPFALGEVEDGADDVSIRAPGFALSVDEDGPQGERARISMNFGGHGISIDALDGEGGESERAHVRIVGADEKSARDFITGADELSPAVQAEMLEILGIE